jgi:hydroxymethylglutaryl-CoA synthase
MLVRPNELLSLEPSLRGVYMALHTPNCKLVNKSYGRLKYNDCLRSTDTADWEGIPNELRKLGYQESLKDKAPEKALVANKGKV